MASEGFRNLRHLPADGSKANDSPCFSIQFKEILGKMREAASSGVLAGFYIIVIIIQFLQHIEKQGKGVLRNSVCGVACNIVCGDSSFFQIVTVKVVKTSGSQAHQLQVLRFPDGLLTDWHLIGYDHICIQSLRFHLICGCCAVNYHFSKSFKWSEYHILAQAVCFQNYNFHLIVLAFFCFDHIILQSFRYLNQFVTEQSLNLTS